MGRFSRGKSAKLIKIPSWTIFAAVLGAMVLAGIMFSRDYRREQGHFKEMFLQRGEILIHSLEMVGRVRFGEQWEAAHIQSFWSNLEDNEGVLFLALTDESGQPLAIAGDARPDPAIFQKPEMLLPEQGEFPLTPNYRLEKIDGRWVYLVYRPFWPQARPRIIIKDGKVEHQIAIHRGKGRKSLSPEEMSRMGPPPPSVPLPPTGLPSAALPPTGLPPAALPPAALSPSQSPRIPLRYLWVGFDLTPFEEISEQRVRTAAVFIALFCLSTLAGVLALIWGHNSRLARQMYQDTNALAAELIGRLPVGVIITDGKGRVTLVNQSTLTISGLKDKDWLNKKLHELTFGRFPEENTLAGREANLSFRGGGSARVALTSGPVVSDDGHPLGQVVLMEDLGEVGRLKAELVKQERLATLGGMAAGLAHEIRNPLGAIRGLAQHLLGKMAQDSPDREALDVMLVSVDRLNSTITDFLEYSRPAEIKTRHFDLVELVRNMAALAGHDARSQAVEIRLDLPSEPVIILGDETLLSQAFLNLYINAIESAGERESGGRLSVALETEENRAVLIFLDNGPGFSAEQLAQPFVPYFTTKAEGTGLGLAMVAKTIRAHQGAEISLSNSPAGGGLVIISFDVISEAAEADKGDALG